MQYMAKQYGDRCHFWRYDRELWCISMVFDEFTVTFDSDGGSAVSEQKVLNTSAIEPNEPKRNGYDLLGGI